ncbi:MAG: winged helix-turn-helix domain-containing protein [Reyranellaceae bacterium]
MPYFGRGDLSELLAYLWEATVSGEGALLFRIDDRVVDLARREVRHNDRRLEVEPRAFDLLAYLISNRDRLVTKDDLIAGVWRGRIVSDSALASALNAARTAIGDNGQEQRLIRTSARQGFRFVATVHVAEEPVPESPSVPPSVVVMPFLNLSGEPDQDYFVDGLVEDIIGALARFKLLRVVPRSASFAWKGKSYEPAQVGRLLDARYLLEGSVRKAGGTLRIVCQLIDGTKGGHLWVDRFDGAPEEVFELQDRVAAAVVGAIVPALTRAETERAKRKPIASLDAYDNFLRGVALSRQFRPETHRQAQLHFYRAMALAPDFSTPFGFATHCYSTSRLQGWDFDPSFAEGEVRRLAEQVAIVGPDDAWAHATAGFSLAWVCRDYGAAAAFGDTALSLNPNLASAWIMRGAISTFCGDQARAIEQLCRASTISPIGAELCLSQGYLAFAFLFAGRLEEAAHSAGHAAAHMPNWLAGHLAGAAAHALLGNDARARQSLATVRLLNPSLRCWYLRDSFSYRRREDGRMLADALRKAGLPD